MQRHGGGETWLNTKVLGRQEPILHWLLMPMAWASHFSGSTALWHSILLPPPSNFPMSLILDQMQRKNSNLLPYQGNVIHFPRYKGNVAICLLWHRRAQPGQSLKKARRLASQLPGIIVWWEKPGQESANPALLLHLLIYKAEVANKSKDSNYHLMRTYKVPGIVLGFLHIFPH